MENKKISVLIPNYNGKNLLEKNLPFVFEALDFSDIDYEVIVADDASVDGSIDFIKARYPEIKICIAEKNKGFSSICNMGIKEAIFEIVLLLNTDVIPEKDFLKFLLPHFANDKVFAVGCLDRSVENGIEIKRGRGIGKFQNGFFVHQKGSVVKNNTLWVSGGSSALRRKTFLELGGFDEIYNPFYWEDIDLSYRAQKRGYKILFESQSRVVHRHDEGVIKNNYSASRVKALAYRNQLIFIWKNITDKKYLKSHFWHLPLFVFRRIASLDFCFVWGLLMAVCKIGEIAKKRNTEKKYCKITDAKILEPYQTEVK